MKNAFQKVIWRTIKNERKRFFSILLITLLGVTTLTGVTASCRDLRYSADRFFDEQNLYDLSIMSTLGLTQEDVSALEKMEGVEAAEGTYSVQVDTQVDGQSAGAEVKELSKKGINVPYVIEGRLPENDREIAVTELYMKDTGKSIGDTLDFTEKTDEDETKTEGGEDTESVFKNTEYTITGTVVDAENVNSAEGSAAFRSTSLTDYTFFVVPEAMDSDVYTEIYLTLSNTDDLLCYSDEYEETVEAVKDRIEKEIKDRREQARYDAVIEEAMAQIDDAQAEMDSEFAKADGEIADARKEINDGKKELEEGQKQLEDQERQAEKAFGDARTEISDGYAELEEGQQEIDSRQQQLEEGRQQLQEGKETLAQKEEETRQQLAEAKAQLNDQKEQTENSYQEALAQVNTISEQFGSLWPESQWKALTEASAQGTSGSELERIRQEFLSALQPVIDGMVMGIDGQITGLDPESEDYEQQIGVLNGQKESLQSMPDQLISLAAGIGALEGARETIAQQEAQLSSQEARAEAEFAKAEQELARQEAQLADGEAQLEAARREIEQGRQELADGEAQLARQEEEADRQIQEGRREIEEGRQELADGEAQLADEIQTYQDEKDKAEKELADARSQVDEIEMARWYIQDRSVLNGYSNIESDSSSIEALGTVFPVIFFIVAILIGLTTITRLVEEERGLVGTYKALGFSNHEIRFKYVFFALTACLLGGAAGDLCGFVLLPKIVFVIFDTMYLLPEYAVRFDLMYGLGGAVLFILGITLAALYACRAELKHTPAALMRPKTPHAGSRIFLERIPVVWKKLSFLNKVAARNIFRYKKRLFMTVLGIMGCTALVICGFTIKDTVSDLLPRQYEQIYQYDLMAVSTADDNEKLISYMEKDGEISDYVNILVDSITVENRKGETESLQMYVIPEGKTLDSYIRLEDLKGNPLSLETGDIYLTQNAAEFLDLKKGDKMLIQDSKLEQQEVTLSQVAQNYLGNTVYMTEDTYKSLFGAYEPNSVLAHFSDTCKDQIGYTDTLGRQDGMVSVSSTQEMEQDFSAAFYLVNMVVYIILILAAALAFVVLFTLSTTNISERVRELATIKVLGFYNNEVHLYVNKETLILTAAGILLGLPFGHVLGNVLAGLLKMPSIQFVASIHPVSYLISAVLSLAFALIVNLVTNRILNKIDMVEALKSVE